MHIVTKILIVFASVLSIVLAALTMAYSVNASRIVETYRNEVAAAQAARAEASAVQQQAATEAQRLNETIAALSTQAADRLREIDDLKKERAGILAKLREAETARDTFENKIAQLGAMAQTQVALIQSYRDEVTKLRDAELGARKREIELVDRINDLDSQRDVLEQTARALQEQLAEARRTIESGGAAAGVLAGADEPFVLPGRAVEGRVTQVSRDPGTGQVLVQVDLGTNDMMRENVKLYVTRGNTFIATLAVIKTDHQWAIGRVMLTAKDATIQQGDRVVTRLQ